MRCVGFGDQKLLNTGRETYALKFIRYKAESLVVPEASERATTCIKGGTQVGCSAFFLRSSFIAKPILFIVSKLSLDPFKH